MASIINATTSTGLVSSADNSGSLQLATNNGTTAVTIDTSQKVGIGTTSPDSNSVVTISGATPNSKLRLAGGTSQNGLTFASAGGGNQFYIYSQSGGLVTYDDTASAERMRITSGGNFLVGGTTPIGSDGNLLANADYTATYRSTGTAGAYIHAFASDIGGTRTVKYAIYANGTAGAVSDQNLKKNIEPARDYLADLMNIEVVKYNWISDEENTPKELGYIAQQVETVFAGMVDEQTYNDGDGNPVTQKMLKKEVFIPMMLKAIQELNAKVETQAVRIAELEGAK